MAIASPRHARRDAKFSMLIARLGRGDPHGHVCVAAAEGRAVQSYKLLQLNMISRIRLLLAHRLPLTKDEPAWGVPSRGLRRSGCNVSSRNGFTLVEIAVVIVVGGMIMAIGIPAFLNFSRSLTGQQALDEVVRALRMAQQTAVTVHSPMIVAFGNGSQTSDVTSYSVHTDRNGDRVVQSSEPWKNYTLPRGALLASVSLQPTDSLIFDTGGSLAPSVTGGQIIVSGNGHRDTLYVSPTGMVYHQ